MSAITSLWLSSTCIATHISNHFGINKEQSHPSILQDLNSKFIKLLARIPGLVPPGCYMQCPPCGCWLASENKKDTIKHWTGKNNPEYKKWSETSGKTLEELVKEMNQHHSWANTLFHLRKMRTICVPYIFGYNPQASDASEKRTQHGPAKHEIVLTIWLLGNWVGSCRLINLLKVEQPSRHFINL